MNKINLALLIYYVTMLAPSQIGYVHFVKMPEMTISFEKTSLFMAALKDSQVEEVKNLEIADVEYKSLELEVFDVPAEDAVEINGPRIVKFDEGMTIEKSQILFVSQADAIQKVIKNQDKLEALSQNLEPAQYNRLLASAQVDEVLDQDWSAQSVEEVAKDLVWQELRDSEEEQFAANQKDQDQDSPWNSLDQALEESQRLVVIQPRRQKSETKQSGSNRANGQLLAKYVPPAPKNNDYDDMAGAKSLFNSKNQNEDRDRPYNLKGNFEFVKGVAYVFGQHELNIYHEFQAGEVSRAQINWSQASFDIFLEHLKGDLVAEIIDLDGFRIAEARINLDGLPSDEYLLSGFFMALEPYYNGYQIQTISAYSFDSYLKEIGNVFFNISGAEKIYQTDGAGVYKERQVLNGSTSNLEFKSSGNWNTLKYVEAGKKEKISIFDDSMVEALIALLKDNGMQVDPYTNGIVWGKIRTEGKSGAGAVVSLSDKNAFGPSYLDDLYLPNKDLVITTKNGYFIYAGVNPGLHTLQVSYRGKKTAKVLEAKRGTITYMDIDLTNRVQQQISIAEVDQNIEEDIETYLIGNNDTKLVQTNPMLVESLSSSSVNLFEFRKKLGDIIYRTHLPQSLRHIKLRLLPEQALLTDMDRLKIDNAIIGFIDPNQYSAVYLNQKSVEDTIRYFDYSGALIAKADVNLKWQQIAAFMIPNVREGSHHLQIFDQKGKSTMHYIIHGEDTVYLLPEKVK